MTNATLCIVFFNQVRWVKDIVHDALQQHVDIIFSDDASTDGTYDEILRCLRNSSGVDLNRIICRRNKKNLGVVGHINAIIPLVKTEFVSFVAGDDRIEKYYFERLVHYFNDGVSCVTPNQYRINDIGRIIDKSRWTQMSVPCLKEIVRSENFRVPSAGTIYRTKFIIVYGPLPDGIVNEDDQILFRALINGVRLICPEYLFFYRVHANSLSSWHWKLGIDPHQLVRKAASEELNRINNLKGWMVVLRQSTIAQEEQNTISTYIDARIGVHIKKHRLYLAAQKNKVFAIFILIGLYANIMKKNFRFRVGRIIRAFQDA